MTAAESVGTRKGNNFLIIETHAAENVAQVVTALGSIGETTVGGAERDITVRATRSVGNDGALHLLDGGNTAEDPKI